MKRIAWKVLAVVVALMCACAGCASGDGGAVVGGMLQGVGQGRSGL